MLIELEIQFMIYVNNPVMTQELVGLVHVNSLLREEF